MRYYYQSIRNKRVQYTELGRPARTCALISVLFYTKVQSRARRMDWRLSFSCPLILRRSYSLYRYTFLLFRRKRREYFYLAIFTIYSLHWFRPALLWFFITFSINPFYCINYSASSWSLIKYNISGALMTLKCIYW